MIRCEEIINDGEQVALFVESTDPRTPLPSNAYISTTFQGVAPDMSAQLSHRDDERNSIVVSVPSALPKDRREEFIRRIAHMSGC